MIKVGIHDSSGSFSDRWITLCEQRKISFRRLNCLSSDIIKDCEGLDAVLWHWPHSDPASQLLARQIVLAMEEKGLRVFPSSDTCWHYDDKLGQKFLLEAVGAPLIPTWIFTDRRQALDWVRHARWPKVFKLRRGAGSANVRLVHSRSEAESLCRKSFGRGFHAVGSYFVDLKARVQRTSGIRNWAAKMLRAPVAVRNALAAQREMPRERGYIYFQEFLSGNEFDTRLTIIGDRAFGFRRMNRPNDFRASGSGKPCYDIAAIDRRCIDIAFETAAKLNTQSLAFDFLLGPNKDVMIGEISYCYSASAVYACTGHWDSRGNWHDGHLWPQEAILDDLLLSIRK